MEAEQCSPVQKRNPCASLKIASGKQLQNGGDLTTIQEHNFSTAVQGGTAGGERGQSCTAAATGGDLGFRVTGNYGGLWKKQQR